MATEVANGCTHCKLPYPADLLSPIFIGGGGDDRGYTQPVCGICALAITNKMHGIKRTHFMGETAEAMRQRALAWRKEHGHAV